MGIPVGMGWVWGLKSHPHGSPAILTSGSEAFAELPGWSDQSVGAK